MDSDNKQNVLIVLLVVVLFIGVTAAIACAVTFTNQRNNDRIKYYADHCKVVKETVTYNNGNTTTVSYACREEK